LPFLLINFWQVADQGEKNMRDIELQELLEAGCHFGHQIRRWNPSMKRFIYGERDGIHILDLAQTKAGLMDGAQYLKEVAARGGTILFVGTKRQAAAIVKKEAIRAGVMYMTERWVGGLLTNSDQLFRRIRKMQDMMAARAAGEYKKYTKREQLLLDREINQLVKFFSGVAELDKLPDVLFVVDVHKEDVAVREAVRMKVPVVGMVDTNGDSTQVDRLIPINDDADKSIELAVGYVADAIIEGKNSKSQILSSKEELKTETKEEVKEEKKAEEKPKKVTKVKKAKAAK
jgi:small subunit ribosomal protein S2